MSQYLYEQEYEQDMQDQAKAIHEWKVNHAVKDILRGKHGVGLERKHWCESQGLDYNEIQIKVNAMIESYQKRKNLKKTICGYIITGLLVAAVLVLIGWIV